MRHLASTCLIWILCCLSTRAAERLEISERYPYLFQDGDLPVVLVGVSDRDALTIWENDKGFSWKTYLDQIAAHGLNYVRQDVFSWGALTAGHSNFYDFSFWRGTGRTKGEGRDSQPPPLEIMEAGRHLMGFISKSGVPFWEMEPHDGLTEVAEPVHAFTLARPGRVYVTYVLGTGAGSVAMSLVEGRYVARWYDPKSGDWVGGAIEVSGGGKRHIETPPYEKDIVLASLLFHLVTQPATQPSFPSSVWETTLCRKGVRVRAR